MRPVRLELKGFTAFRDEQTIEFDDLDLFAISGPTGSGKTSILDAITYALYGTIERVGKQAGQFVSQGQPRMSVLLEFAVGGERYLVSRSTPVSGPTKIMLQRWGGDDWRQVGEGADRVTGANAIIRSALGLDYESFTRTVLLPQGKFAQFLSGDAKERRDILTELLGLELFKRLAQRAGEVKREADAEVRAKTTVLQREYVGVTAQALGAAEQQLRELRARNEALDAADMVVRELAQRGMEAARSVGELRSVGDDAEAAGEVAARASEELVDLAGDVAEADRLVKEAIKEQRAAHKAAERAAAALAEAVSEGGSPRDLERLRAKAEAQEQIREQIQEAEAEAKEARDLLPASETALARAEEALAVAVADAEAAILAVESARQDEHDADHADMAMTLRSEVHAGDECPVCGREIERLPRGRRAPTLARARAARTKAEAAAEKATRGIESRKSARDAVERDAADAARRRDAAERSKAKLVKEAAGVADQLVAALGSGAAKDPLRAVDQRLERLESLEEATTSANDEAARAKDAVVAAERRQDALSARAAEHAARLESLPVQSIADRAREAARSDLAIDDFPLVGGKEPSALGRSAAALAERLSSLVERLRELTDRRSKAARALLSEVHAAVEGLVEPSPTLAGQVEAIGDARMRAGRALATAEHSAAELRSRFENAERLQAEVVEQRVRLSRFDALSKELRADRVISFLQAEALQILAASGSERLALLSSGRYRLAFDDDEFFVVDTWNGEERRSVRTLSGGETFLASLALALALSEQVRSLSVGEKARLDSLFLDEGFGTLDPESLEVVIDAIEQLGGDGRMVGVITHVQELAIRLPARIEVEKSPRGSRLAVVAAD
jgi:exonuclease SbcC